MKPVSLLMLLLISLNGLSQGYKWNIAPQFENSSNFGRPTLAPVQLGGKWGYINKSGVLVISYQFEEAGNFEEGLAPAQMNGKWGYINAKGFWVIQPQFDEALGFTYNGEIVAVKQSSFWGFINRDGKWIIPPQFEQAVSFSEGLAAVRKSKLWGFINAGGKWIVTPQFKQVGSFHEGITAAQFDNGLWGCIDKGGRIIVNPTFEMLGEFRAEMIAARQNNVWGYINRSGIWVITPSFEEAYDFEGGFAMVRQNGKLGYINRSGIWIIPPAFDYAQSFAFGLACVSQNGKWGYIAYASESDNSSVNKSTPLAKIINKHSSANETNVSQANNSGTVTQVRTTQATTTQPAATQATATKQTYNTPKNSFVASYSSVPETDRDIPVTQQKYPYRFALIIGNEDYSSFQQGLGGEVNVAFAANDAKIFMEYAMKTLGIPEENCLLLINAQAIEMKRAITKMSLYAKNTFGKSELFVYYAGHGFPDEKTKESYLMPVDVDGTDLSFAVKTSSLYAELTKYPSQKVTVFLDACFSGGARNQGLLAARGVKIKPKENQLNGNLIVFAASSDDQSSLAYTDKQHGMFTYFLLRKLQETKGLLSYQDLSQYLTEQVAINSIRVNNKEQNPQTNISPAIQSAWSNWSFLKK